MKQMAANSMSNNYNKTPEYMEDFRHVNTRRSVVWRKLYYYSKYMRETN